jgi:hypothetical protein
MTQYDLSSVLGDSWKIPQSRERNKKKYIRTFFQKILLAIKTMSNKKYWTKANLVEAWGFGTKLTIIIPGLIFGYQWWWLYIFALVSSIALIWSSTVKTLPTIILFNVVWVLLAITAIAKHFI